MMKLASRQINCLWLANGVDVRAWMMTVLVILAYGYLAVLAGWAGLHLLFGDRWWWLFLLNALAIYLFLPLPLAALVALVARRLELWPIIGGALLLALVLYGGLFVPPVLRVRASAEAAPVLSVMSYNLLVHSQEPARMVAAIRAAGADVVALQELNPAFAEALQRDLRGVYPYQVLHPQDDTSGMGVISRYPLRATGVVLPGAWHGPARVFELDFAGMSVLLLNIHARSTSLGYGGNLRIAPARIEASIREREQQMQTLADLAARSPGPLIAAGDFNTGERSTAYAIVARVLNDAWREAGRGPGHTFPGAATPGSSRPSIANIHIPMWLIRIDYIFSSPHWRTLSAEIGPWDGVSDHRPVVARLALVAGRRQGISAQGGRQMGRATLPEVPTFREVSPERHNRTTR